MKDIKFTCLKNTFVVAGTPGRVLALSDIDVTKNYGIPKTSCPYIQMFTTGKRVKNETVVWDDWNGIVTIDIDSKNAQNIETFNIDEMEKKVINTLSYDAWDNFYCEQRSNSGTSFHFFFYFDVDKNEQNYTACVKYAMHMTKCAFVKCGYEKLFDGDKDKKKKEKVADDCTKKYAQGIYISAYPFLYNILGTEINGQINAEELEYYIEDEAEFEQTSIDFKRTKLKYNKDIADNIIDWHNENRRRLITILAEYFEGNINDARDVFMYCYDNIFGNKIINHTRKEILAYFNRDFMNTYKGHYAFHNMMLNFCKVNLGMKFTKKFTPKKIDDIKYDEVIELGDEKLSKVIYNIFQKDNKLIEIVAGCGFGKTFAAKSLANSSFMKDIDLLLNGITKFTNRICFVTPCTSINGDNFDGYSNWRIIDSAHDNGGALNKTQIIKNKNLSICTTWNSFDQYNIYNEDFDVFFFDEIHTLYSFDYRPEITKIKRLIKSLIEKGKKVIFMTGTPSYEITEFKDSYKIKVNKNDTKVNCDIVFYNEKFEGYIVNDIKQWLNKDENNLVAIFNDMANAQKTVKFDQRHGIKIDTLYNKSNCQAVKYIMKHHMWKGRTFMCSVYGQTGINLLIPEGKKVRIYITNTQGMNVIQYANRIRNKEAIDKIVIPYKNDKINNSIIKTNGHITFDEISKRITELNRINKINEDIFTTKNKKIFLLRNKANEFYLDRTPNNELRLNEENYIAYELIKRTLKYEEQIQVLWNRLIDANFDVNLIYLHEDIEEKTKKINICFGEKILAITKNDIKMTANGQLYIDMENVKEAKFFNETDKDNIEFILNQLKTKYTDNYYEKFVELITNAMEMHPRFSKIDIKRIKDVYIRGNEYRQYVDDWYIKQIVANKNIIDLTAIYITKLYDKNIDTSFIFDEAEEVYHKLKEIKIELNKYSYITKTIYNIDEDNIYDLYENADINYRKRIYSKVKKYLDNEFGKKYNSNSDKCKKIMVDGIEYNSVVEACNKLKKSKMTINRWIKNNKHDAHFIDEK